MVIDLTVVIVVGIYAMSMMSFCGYSLFNTRKISYNRHITTKEH